ncbi:MAG: hydroxylamine oxidoreductase, partial [Candidatus Thioglobus sp.]|nr:hydroxylamine oxidoreductase [Candidatus Thioglobus sp.]
MKQIIKSLIFFLSLMFLSSSAFSSVTEPPAQASETSKQCTTCHKKNDNGIVQQWGDSKHHRAKVGCYECHAANKEDKDAFLHGKRGNEKYISIIVSPRDCANCHAQEVKEAEESHHAKAGRILGSLDNLLAEVVEGNSNFVTGGFPEGNSAAAVNGCWQCHGSQVKVLEDGALDPATWPNTGIGRINPDGSEGSCTACHARHSFSVEQARAPETCGKCHMGPDHP